MLTQKGDKICQTTIWMTIDFEKVKQRINLITAQIEEVLIKYHTLDEISKLKGDNN